MPWRSLFIGTAVAGVIVVGVASGAVAMMVLDQGQSSDCSGYKHSASISDMFRGMDITPFTVATSLAAIDAAETLSTLPSGSYTITHAEGSAKLDRDCLKAGAALHPDLTFRFGRGTQTDTASKILLQWASDVSTSEKPAARKAAMSTSEKPAARKAAAK